MLYFLKVGLGAEYTRILFLRLFVKNCTTNRQSYVAVCGFGEYAMSLDHSTEHDSFKSREQNVSDNKVLVIKNVSNNKNKRL